MPVTRSAGQLALLAIVLTIAGCSSSSSSDDDSGGSGILNDEGGIIPVITDAPEQDADPIADPSASRDDVAGARVDDSEGSYVPGAPPAAIGSLTLDPLTADLADTTVIPGGSVAIPVQASAPFSTVYVVANQAGESAAGYFEILLPEAVTQAELVLTYQTELSQGSSQQVDVQVGAPDGSISSTGSATLQTVVVGTGDLQVSVSWGKETDVDLFLLEPGGEEISFVNVQSQAGGVLDLDSNPACSIDGVKNENITYEGVTPPAGTYTVVVDYYSECGLGSTNYVVTVRNGGVVSTYSGTLTSTSERQEVTTFEVR